MEKERDQVVQLEGDVFMKLVLFKSSITSKPRRHAARVCKASALAKLASRHARHLPANQ